MIELAFSASRAEFLIGFYFDWFDWSYFDLIEFFFWFWFFFLEYFTVLGCFPASFERYFLKRLFPTFGYLEFGLFVSLVKVSCWNRGIWMRNSQYGTIFELKWRISNSYCDPIPLLYNLNCIYLLFFFCRNWFFYYYYFIFNSVFTSNNTNPTPSTTKSTPPSLFTDAALPLNWGNFLVKGWNPKIAGFKIIFLSVILQQLNPSSLTRIAFDLCCENVDQIHSDWGKL